MCDFVIEIDFGEKIVYKRSSDKYLYAKVEDKEKF